VVGCWKFFPASCPKPMLPSKAAWKILQTNQGYELTIECAKFLLILQDLSKEWDGMGCMTKMLRRSGGVSRLRQPIRARGSRKLSWARSLVPFEWK
jgi:hypothetical protein